MSRKLVVGAFSPSVLLRVSRRLGLLGERGLEVEERPVPSSPAQFRALLDGEIDAALTSPDNVIAYRFVPGNPLGRTADARIVAAIDRGLGLGVYGRSGITSPAALQGATIGVDVPGSGFAFGLYALLESLGVPRDRYRVAALGSTPRRLDALLAGRCDATMLNAGNELRAEAAGLVRLAGLTDHCDPYLGTVLAALGGRGGAPADAVKATDAVETVEATDAVDAVEALAGALHTAATQILAGRADEPATDEAASALDLPAELAARYVERLKDPRDGLTAERAPDMAALRTVVELRRRYAPTLLDGVDVPTGGRIDVPTGGRIDVPTGGRIDVLATALDPGSGLIDTGTAGTGGA